MDNFKTLKETEELVTDSNNRYKITVELANIAKRYEYEFKNISKSTMALREKPIIVGLKVMVKKAATE
jgi:Flp pilus assembly CpaF family ATPase